MRTGIIASKPASEDYKITFEEYKILFEWANKIADRRQVTSNLFLGVDGALITVIGLALTQISGSDRVLILAFFSIIGVIVSYIWSLLLQKYQQILRFKYTQLTLFEKCLGLEVGGLVSAEEQFFTKGIDLQALDGAVALKAPIESKGFGITFLEQSLAQVFIAIFVLTLVVAFL